MEEIDPHGLFRQTEVLARVGRFASEDPCIQELAHAPWDCSVTPLSRGPYKDEITFLASPRLTLYRERFWVKTRIQGLSPSGMFAFAVPLKVGSDSAWWGAPLHQRGLPIMMPGGVHVDMSRNQQHLLALVDLGLFRNSLPVDLREAIENEACQHLLPATQDAIARLGATLKRLLDEAQADPQGLQHPNAIRCMEQDLMAAFRQSLQLPVPPLRRVGRAIRQRGLNRAIEYLRFADTGSVTVADLCAAAQVTQRTLEYAFRATFGVSPRAYLQLRRYHKTRRDLRLVENRAATVAEIAGRNGFYQLGRFAVRYKQLFGESPSDTLVGPCRDIPHGLLRMPG